MRRVIDERQRSEYQHHRDQDRQCQRIQRGTDRDHAEHDCPGEIRTDQNRLPPITIHHDACEQAEQEIGQPSSGVEDADLGASGLKGDDGKYLQGQASHRRAHHRDRVRQPEPHIGGISEQREPLAHPATLSAGLRYWVSCPCRWPRRSCGRFRPSRSRCRSAEPVRRRIRCRARSGRPGRSRSGPG